MSGWWDIFHAGETQGIRWFSWVGQISKGCSCSLQFLSKAVQSSSNEKCHLNIRSKRTLNCPVEIMLNNYSNRPCADCFISFILLNLRRGTNVLKCVLKQLLPWTQILCWIRKITFLIFSCTNAKVLPSLNFPDPFYERIAFQYPGAKPYIPSEQEIFLCPCGWQVPTVLSEPAMQLGNACSKAANFRYNWYIHSLWIRHLLFVSYQHQ